MVNLPTLHRRRDELCRTYFAKMKSRDHKLNAFVPNGRSVPYALRLCNKLPIPRTNLVVHHMVDNDHLYYVTKEILFDSAIL